MLRESQNVQWDSNVQWDPKLWRGGGLGKIPKGPQYVERDPKMSMGLQGTLICLWFKFVNFFILIFSFLIITALKFVRIFLGDD